MQVHTLPPKKGGRGGPAVQACSCKPNADGRCCLAATCGCSKAALGCSPKCGCRGFVLVCGNKAGPPLDKPAAKQAVEPPAKKAKAAPAPFAGAGHRLADGPFELAAAPDRSRFLAALEASQVPKPAPAPEPAPLPAAAEEDVIVISDDDDDAPAPQPAPQPLSQLAAPRGEVTAALPPKPAPKPPPPKPAPKLPLPKPAASFDPFNPPQYVPAGGFKPGGELRVRETARLTDVDGRPVAVVALLDTGNEGCTLISRAAALRAGLADAAGMPVGLGGGRVEWIEVNGVVAGARERLPMLHIQYELQGKKVRVKAAVTKATLGCDLLLSRHDILLFTADGFTLSAKN